MLRYFFRPYPPTPFPVNGERGSEERYGRFSCPGYFKKNHSAFPSAHGVTLLELLVAITIAGIVTTLCFTLYGYVTKNFSQQTKSIERLRSTMLAKKRIDRTIGRISTLIRSTEREVCGIDGALDSIITCRYSGTTLLANGDTIATGLGAFRFSVVEERHGGGNNTAVLLWDAECAKNGDWIGGAVTVRMHDTPHH